jgi:hypothetical protein
MSKRQQKRQAALARRRQAFDDVQVDQRRRSGMEHKPGSQNRKKGYNRQRRM